MQEEITQGATTLIIETTKLTAEILQAAMRKALEEIQKGVSNRRSKLYRGKQTIRQLMRHNTVISSIEITDSNIKAFSETAKKYGIDFALKKDTSTASGDWNLTAFGDKNTLANEKVDSNKLGFALTLGNGQQVQTTTDASTQKLISAPTTGCYMTGVGDTSGNTVSVGYKAIVTPLSSAVDKATIANVVFVIEWDI